MRILNLISLIKANPTWAATALSLDIILGSIAGVIIYLVMNSTPMVFSTVVLIAVMLASFVVILALAFKLFSRQVDLDFDNG